MNIYLLETDVNKHSYDVYNSCVVCASDEKEAVKIHPDNELIWDDAKGFGENSYDWVDDLNDIKCTLIGDAAKGQVKGVICASFNAG